MDEVTIAIAKLQALHKTVSNRLAGRGLYFDPPTVVDYFERYERLRDQLKALFPDLFSDIPTRQIPKSSGTVDNEGRGYIERNYIGFLLSDMTEILEIWERSRPKDAAAPAMKVTREGVFFAGQYFDALLRVRDILAQAKKSIVIIDGYVNEDVLNLVSEKDKAVEVKILTKSVSAALNTAANAFNRQYGSLSIRTSSVFHDRFVIIDDGEFYHFGASIKDLGNRGFMFSLIEESFVIEALRKQFSQEWANATVMI